MTTSVVNWKKGKDQVLSWIENEQHCVTAQRISQTLDVSRKQGSLLLKEILQEKAMFQITTCHQMKEGNVTVFRLRTSTSTSAPDEDDESSNNVFALASTEATELVTTAHERDMVQWRDMVAERRQGSGGAIAPADEILESKDQQPQRQQLVQEDTAPAQAIRTHKPFAGAKAKPTTAASFFAKQKEVAKPKEKEVKKDVKASNTKKPSNSKKVSQEKENARQKTARKKQVAPSQIGNADDFVADEEESDDDQVQEVVVVKPKKSKVTTRKEPTPPPSPQASSPVRGAMDAFAEKDPNRKRKRRKKLVEKTSKVNGYIRTDTEMIWEDVPTDEEVEEEKKTIVKTKIKPAPAKSKQSMKQMGMMGFFKKK